MSDTAYVLERGWVDGAARDDVLVEVADGRFTTVLPDAPADRARGVRHLPGLTLPGLANAHSHVFHRALRGRTQRVGGRGGSGSFWTWREQMYAVATVLDPDSLHRLARAAYREMAAAGITGVGEFHYLHHQPDGTAYDEANAMGVALLEAGREVGVRVTLLDACYVSGGFGAPVEGVQRRFSDGDVDAWAARVAALPEPVHGRVGAALHSVRAVPLEQLRRWSGPLVHVHLSEQRAENEECLARLGATPAQVLAEAGQLHAGTTVVHATHLGDGDAGLLGAAGVTACLCPTTERDLGDGIGPGRTLDEAGVRLSLGSDSHAVVDPFEEMRAVELHERLATERRGHWPAAALLAAGLRHDSIGFPDAGRIAVGARADLVTVDTGSARTAGTGADEHTAVWAASAADVIHVVADGRLVHTAADREDVGRELAGAVAAVWDLVAEAGR
ncbi:formimidoylglutamate deiminase [Nocardioides sp. zg-DK7169]|uniref:formimidoylglutamate deiminase n=1 Tax=Nocardioides sp. zg-DK7169 TaxID=2736600 RepID=UPI0015546A69|nr:formimidoylglutamate deiminase [Nocardioides sp. zg-DK7169]NPC96988.1 formimidoylglutamate deiminase [Nocardioides sp. zg-DK7169]